MNVNNQVAHNSLEDSQNSQNALLGKWDLYYHLPQNKSWDLASYKLILGDIDTADKLVDTNRHEVLYAFRYAVWSDTDVGRPEKP